MIECVVRYQCNVIIQYEKIKSSFECNQMNERKMKENNIVKSDEASGRFGIIGCIDEPIPKLKSNTENAEW